MKAMQSTPWHLRQASFEHHRWFQDLIDLHALTHQWLSDFEVNEAQHEHLLQRVLAPEIREHLPLLNQISNTTLSSEFESVLHETYPEEFLKRFEETVWTVQAWSLQSLLEKTPSGEKPALMNSIEKSAWKAGRICLQKRWPHLVDSGQDDIRILASLFQNSPLSGYPDRKVHLVQRATAQSMEWILLDCPHRRMPSDTGSIADELCRVHHHWMHGFAYGMNPRIASDYLPRKIKLASESPLCGQKWYLHR